MQVIRPSAADDATQRQSACFIFNLTTSWGCPPCTFGVWRKGMPAKQSRGLTRFKTCSQDNYLCQLILEPRQKAIQQELHGYDHDTCACLTWYFTNSTKQGGKIQAAGPRFHCHRYFHTLRSYFRHLVRKCGPRRNIFGTTVPPLLLRSEKSGTHSHRRQNGLTQMAVCCVMSQWHCTHLGPMCHKVTYPVKLQEKKQGRKEKKVE